jgi:transposase
MPRRDEWAAAPRRKLGGILPGNAGDRGRTAAGNRTFVSGVRWVLRSGAHWKHLPARYGNWKGARKRFTRWAKAGVWERIFAMLMQDPKNPPPMIDSTIVRAHQQSAAGRGGIGARRWGVPAGD